MAVTSFYCSESFRYFNPRCPYEQRLSTPPMGLWCTMFSIHVSLMGNGTRYSIQPWPGRSAPLHCSAMRPTPFQGQDLTAYRWDRQHLICYISTTIIKWQDKKSPSASRMQRATIIIPPPSLYNLLSPLARGT